MKFLSLFGMIIVATFFLLSCQDKNSAADSEDGGDQDPGAGEASGGNSRDEKSSQGSARNFNLQDCLVGVKTLRKSKEWDSHVGLGFRLSSDSEQSFVVYFGGELSKNVQVFVEGAHSYWSSAKVSWKGKQEGGLRIIRLPASSERKFPLLSEYPEIDHTGEQAWFAEEGEGLFSVDDKDREMQEILNQEAVKLVSRIEKYRQEQSKLRSQRISSRSRVYAAVTSELEQSTRDLDELRIRALRLGLKIRTGAPEDDLDKGVRFVERLLPAKGDGSDQAERSRGVVTEGGLALTEGEKTTAILSASGWKEAIRLKLESGKVWFSSSREKWVIKTSFQWHGYYRQVKPPSFELWPIVGGQPDEAAAIEIEEGVTLSSYPLANLAGHKANRFRCRFAMNAENGESFVRSFDFKIGKDQDGNVIPVSLESDDLKVEAELPGSSSSPGRAIPLKTLPAGGVIKNAVSYQSGRRLLIQIMDPAMIKVVDTEVMTWLKEWKLPGDQCVTASNGKDLFVYCPHSHELMRRGLSRFEELKIVLLNEGDKILAMGIATEVSGAPLLAVYQDRLELRDPRTLEVIERALQKFPRSSSDMPSEAEMDFSDVEGRVVVSADPLGEAFAVSYLSDEDEGKLSKTEVAFRKHGNWFQERRGDSGVVSRGKTITYQNRLKEVYEAARTIKLDSFNGSFIFHSEGRGIMGCEVRDHGTFPPVPIKISYLPSEDGDFAPLCYAAAGSIKHLTYPGLRRARIRDFLPIFLNPVCGVIVSLGGSEVVFERIPEGVFSPGQVLERTPPARRGEKWSYRPKANDGSVPDYEIVKGPKGMIYSNDDGFLWEVPPGLLENIAQVEVKLSGSAQKTTFTVSILGDVLTSMTDLSSNGKETAIPTLKKVSLEQKLSDLISVRSSDVILVLTNDSRRLRVVDLSTGDIQAALESPGGPMKVCAMHDGVLICYLDGMILEKRSIPDLKVIKTAESKGSGQLLALAVGKVKESGRPFGIFDTGQDECIVREMDLETLTFERGLPLNKFWTHLGNDLPSGWVRETAISEDGRLVWFDNQLIRQESPGSYTFFDQIVSLSSRGPFFTDTSGSKHFTSKGVLNHATKQSWTIPSGKGELLISDDRGDWFFSLNIAPIYRSRDLKGTIEIYDAVTKNVQYRLDGFSEWNGNHYRLVKGTVGFRRAFLCGSGPYLVTTSSSEKDLFIRRLPIKKN